MKSKSLLIALALSLPLSIYASGEHKDCEDCNNSTTKIVSTQTETNTTQSTPKMASIEDGYKLLESMRVKNNYEAIIERITNMQIKQNPTLQEVRPTIQAFFKKSMGWDSVKEDIANLYIKHYTAKEIDELNAFYNSPTGQKSLDIMPQLASTGAIIQQNKLMANMKDLKAMVAQELKKLNSKRLHMSSPFNIK